MLIQDICESKSCDLDDLKALDVYQGFIKKLERKLDAGSGLRAEAATERKKENVRDNINQVEGEGFSQSDFEITHHEIPDRNFNECLLKKVPSTHEDIELRRYLECSHDRLEVEWPSSFLNLCNRALNRINNLPLDMLRPTSHLRSSRCILKSEIFHGDSLGGLACEHIMEIDPQPRCLGGRVNTVLGALYFEDGTQRKLAHKICFPEILQEAKGKTIEELRREIKDSETEHPLSDVLMYRDMSCYGTQQVKSMLQISIRGYRNLGVSVSRKFAPLTDLKGAKFVKAWLEVVRFHAFLWNIGVEHGDPSLWNVMYNENLECGVLCDYDLSISRQRPRVFGTGMIPFIALELLTPEYWAGKIERLYRHELEAFIWMLPFVFLRYQDKRSRRGTPVDRWMTSNYDTCFQQKNAFWMPMKMIELRHSCQLDFKDLWFLADHLIDWWRGLINVIGRAARMRAIDQDQGLETNVAEDDNNVASMWSNFIVQLKRAADQFSRDLGFIEGLIQELDLETLCHYPPYA